jgi:HAD superfamily hydrolase (TIGR01509 family)
MTIRAVVFDMDGVLIDSEGWWDEVRRGLAADAGRPWPAAATRAMQGMSTREWAAYLVGPIGIPGSAEAVADTVIEQMAARYERRLPLLPGAVAVVERLSTSWPLGLASSSPRRLIDTVLAASGLTDRFEVSISTEEVAAGKPSPDVYLEAVHRLGVGPQTAVAIEDSSNGLRSAAAAGLIVLAVPQAQFPPAADALKLARADVARLSDITIDLIVGLEGWNP